MCTLCCFSYLLSRVHCSLWKLFLYVLWKCRGKHTGMSFGLGFYFFFRDFLKSVSVTAAAELYDTDLISVWSNSFWSLVDSMRLFCICHSLHLKHPAPYKFNSCEFPFQAMQMSVRIQNIFSELLPQFQHNSFWKRCCDITKQEILHKQNKYLGFPDIYPLWMCSS